MSPPVLPVLRYKEVFSTDIHAVGITSLAFSPLGTFLATAGLDRKVCIWYVESNRSHRTFTGETAVLSLAWLPNREDKIVIGYQDGNVAILSLTSVTAIHTNGFWAHDFPVECLDVHGDLIATGAQHEVRVWEWHLNEPWKKIVTLPHPPTTSHNYSLEILITSVQWTSWQSRRTPVLSVTYMNHGVFFYEATSCTSWRLVHRIPIQLPISRSRLSTNGDLIAVSSLGKGFDVYETLSGAAKCTFPHDAREKYLTPILFIHGDTGVMTGTTIGTATLWDVNSSLKIQDLAHQKDDRVLCIAAHYVAKVDRFLIATGTYGRRGQPTVKVWATAGRLGSSGALGNPAGRKGLWQSAYAVIILAVLGFLFFTSKSQPAPP